MTFPLPVRSIWLRRVALGCLALLLLVVATIAAIPWWLGTDSGRRWLLSKADAALAPGRLEIRSLGFSWIGPTRMKGFVIRNGSGKAVVDAPTAMWDRNLYQALFERPKLGRLTLDLAALDVARSSEGTIDLYETLRPVIKGDPRLELQILVRRGRIRFQSPELADPVLAEPAEVDLALVPRPDPLRWALSLTGEQGRSKLEIRGFFNAWQQREGKPADLELAVAARAWPFRASLRGVEASTRLDGSIHVQRASSFWHSVADARLLELAVAGSALRGDQPRFDRVQGRWNVTESAAGWVVDNLDLSAPFAQLKGSGKGTAGDLKAAIVEGEIDLAALARAFPRALRLRDEVVVDQGSAHLRISTGRAEDRPHVALAARVSDLKAHRAGRPVALTAPATLEARLARATSGAYQVEQLSVETPYLKATAQGDRAGGVTTLRGSFDLAGLHEQLRQVTDLGNLAVAGHGGFQGEYRTKASAYRGQFESDLHGVRLGGLALDSLTRDAIRARFEVDGPLDATGLPNGWTNLASHVASGSLTAALDASSVSSEGHLLVRSPLGRDASAPLGTLAITGAWRDQGLDLNTISASLAPTKPDDRRPPLRLTATGRYDRAAGRVRIVPMPAAKPGDAIRVVNDGWTVAGLGPRGEFRVDGGLEGTLADLAAWLPASLTGIEGDWTARVSARPDAQGSSLGGELLVDGLSIAGKSQRLDAGGPVRVSVQGLLSGDSNRIDISELAFRSRYASAEAQGRIDDLSGSRNVELTGRVLPEWDSLSERLATTVEPGARVRGRPHPLRLSTRLDEHWRESVEAEVGVRLDEADIFGLQVGQTPLVVRVKKGVVSVDPVTVPVNGGWVHLEPDVVSDDEGPSLTLGAGSTIRDVQINERVSHRFLSFVAPVLDRATRVRGSVSADLDDAVIPLSGPRTVRVEGSVVFQNVEFTAGPFLDPLMGLIGRADHPLVRLDQPVELSIADRKVYQKGLSIPIGKLSRIDMEGSVDFERNLDMVASIPVIPPGLADKPVIGDFIGTTMIRVPIRGTLQKPVVDKEAFNLGMKQTGQSLLERSMTRGAVGLFDLLTRPRDPNAPQPKRQTPAERREERQRKQAERRRQRGVDR